MKTKFNRLIAMALIAVMSAAGLTAFAAETEADITADVTTADTESTADADEHYQEAIGFLNYLGIFTGDENGDMRPEDTISRAEIAAIILREININNMSSYSGSFSDVDSTHWAADIIQTAYENGIINGYDDGTFRPDDDVTYEQAVKMVICAINYESYVVSYGGYPTGYIMLAHDKGISDNASGTIGEPVTRRTVAKLVYNSLTVGYPVISGSDNINSVTYTVKDGVTVLSEKRDIYYKDGIITAAPGKSIDMSVSLIDGQIAFEDEIMNSELSEPEKFVAEYVRLFYRDKSGKGDDKTALYAVPLNKKTESVTLEADEIDSITTGYCGGTPQIEYYSNSRQKKLKLSDQPIIVYNDQPFTEANYASVDPKDDNGESISFDEFITPYEGSVEAVDFGSDGYYDILFVDSYETSVVKVATALRLQLEYPISVGDMIKLDTSENTELKVNVLRDGEPIGLRDLSEGDVVSIRMNANFNDDSYTGEKYITIETSMNYVEGTVSSILSAEENGCKAIINNTEYKIVDNDDIINNVKALMGSSGKFYLNKFGTISYVDGNIIGGLSAGEKYGWLMKLYTEDSGDDFTAKLYTSDGEIKSMRLNGSVDYWAPDAVENRKAIAKEIVDEVINQGDSYFLNCQITGSSETAAIRLCKFKTNSDGEITRLYMAVDEKTVDEHSGAVRVDTSDHKESHISSGLFAKRYVINSGVPQMTVPISSADLGDADNYNYRIADSSEFTSTVGDKDLGYSCFFADVYNYAPGIAIKMINSVSETHTIDEYSTADDNSVILVSSVNEAVDSNGETVYEIKGYHNGELKEYTTAKNVLVAQVNPAVRLDKETYDTTTIWTQDSDKMLSDVIHPGDICGIDGSNSSLGIILRMVDTQGLADHLAGGGMPGTVQSGQFRYDEMFSSTRDRVIFGYVTEVRTSPIVQFDLAVDGSSSSDEDGDVVTDGSTSITVGVPDLNRAVHFVTINSSGKIKVDKDVSDAYKVEAGDYVFMRNFRNDESRELYVIRYE